MMLRPAIGELLAKIGTEDKPGTRYSLVIATAKRARRLNEANADKKSKPANYVSTAIKEIDEGLVKVNSDAAHLR